MRENRLILKLKKTIWFRKHRKSEIGSRVVKYYYFDLESGTTKVSQSAVKTTLKING